MTEEEKRALLEGVRGEVFDRALGEAQHDREAATLRRERDEARAQLAALREAAGPHAASEYASDADTRVLRIVLADAEDAVEAHDRRVRAEALREAADASDRDDSSRARWLRARADEIEEGR